MKKIYSFVMGLMLLCTTANAQEIYSYEPSESRTYCEELLCDVDFTVYADYLYWKECRSDLGFDNTIFVNPDYSSGWRVGGIITKSNWDAGVKYTSFTTSKTASFADPFANNIQARYDADWDIVDIETGYSLYHDCGQALLRPFAGVKLAWNDELKETINSLTEASKLHFEACGLYTGLEGRFMLCNAQFCDTCIPFYLVGRGSAAILKSSFRQNILVNNSPSETFDKQCIYMPVLEAFIGLDIGGSEIYCVTPHILIGYEVQSWLGRSFHDSSQTANVGLGGLVARLALNF
jgi:hypothetical protein